jgi:hypothetical protein
MCKCGNGCGQELESHEWIAGYASLLTGKEILPCCLLIVYSQSVHEYRDLCKYMRH